MLHVRIVRAVMQVLGAMELLMSAFPADAPAVLEAPLQRLLAALLAGSETGQVIAGARWLWQLT